MEVSDTRQEMLALTAEIVSSFVGNNSVATGDLPKLISSVFSSLSATGEPEAPKALEAPTPAVPIKKSVGTDYIVCLEDGKKLKMLKRHLATRYNMTPEDYRQRWGLPADYPMVAPDYASKRSALAKSFGLGRKPAAAEPVVAAAPMPEVVAVPPAAAKSRPVRIGGRRKEAVSSP
jgi:predicted transcriptional regulator